MSNQPLIDSARLQFSGLSSEDFEDVPEIGEQRTYTIIASCQSHTERAMANEGTRKSVNMKVVRVLSGVTEKINEPQEPSLFDGEDGDEIADENDTDDGASEEHLAEVAEHEAGLSVEDEEPSNVTAFTGPAFSSTD